MKVKEIIEEKEVWSLTNPRVCVQQGRNVESGFKGHAWVEYK